MRDLLEAREKRRLESLRVQRSILKSKSCDLGLAGALLRGGASHSKPGKGASQSQSQSQSLTSTATEAGSSLSDELSSGTDKYSATLERLNKYKRRDKASSKSRSLKEEWYNEQKHLQSSARNIVGDLCSVLEVMILHDPSDSDVLGMIDVRNAVEDRATQDKEALREHLGDIKEFVLGNANGRRKTGVVVTAEYGDGVQRTKTSKATRHVEDSIVADVLMQVRTGTSERWTSLEKEEGVLVAQVVAEHLAISKMLRNDRRDVQNNHIAINLARHEDDDCEVLLAIEEWYGKLAAMDEAHEKNCRVIDQERNKITAEYQDEVFAKGEGSEEAHSKSEETSSSNCDRDNPETDQEVGPDNVRSSVAGLSGPWNQEEHMAFVKVFRRSNSVGSSRGTLLTQWQALLPQKNRRELLRHEKWYRQCRSLADKKKLVTCTYEMGRVKMLAEACEAIESLRLSRIKAREEERARQYQEESRRLLHEHLMILKAEKQQEAEKRKVEEALEEEMRSQQEKSLMEHWLKEQERKKSLVIEFQRLRAEAIAKQKIHDEALLKKQQDEIRRLVESNRENVEGRELVRLDKEREKQQKVREKEEEEAKRLEILANLAMTVPYWDAIENATSQLDHVTAAVKAQEWQQPEEMSRGFLALNGFGDKKIIRDARFRLAEALRGAGIAQSKVAADVVREFHPRPQLAIMGIIFK